VLIFNTDTDGGRCDEDIGRKAQKITDKKKKNTPLQTAQDDVNAGENERVR